MPVRIMACEPVHKHAETILPPKSTSSLNSQDTKSIDRMGAAAVRQLPQGHRGDQTRNKTFTSHASLLGSTFLYYKEVSVEVYWFHPRQIALDLTIMEVGRGERTRFISLPKFAKPLHGMQLSIKPFHFSSFLRICKPDGSLCTT